MSSTSPVFVSIETSAFSGATLLAFLLGAHPQIATVGEMDGLIPCENPDEYLCSCGQKIKVCEFWRSVKIAMQSRGFEFDVVDFNTKFALGGPRLIQYLRFGSLRNSTLDSIRDAILYAWPWERLQLGTLVARNEAFVESVLEVTGKEVFVDSSKDSLRLKSLSRFSSLDVRAIHLVRDVRGVVCSRLRRGGDVDVHRYAKQWVKSHKKIHTKLQNMPPGAHTLLRYEDLCQDVQGTLERIFSYCGVDRDVRVTDFRKTSHHIVGNAMRLKPVSQVKLDERWKTMLTKDQLREIDQVAGALGRRYGYY